MSFVLRKSTAGQVVQFKMVDSTTGLKKTGLTIANTDIKLVFDDGTTQTSKNSGGATEIGSTGVYYMTLDATDTATLGRLRIDIEVAGALPWFADLMVMTALSWDAFYAASGGSILADVQTIKTQTVTCAAGVTVGAFVGNATAALSVDASGRVDIGKALGTAVTLDANNVLNVSAKYWAGTAITATSIPVATAAGAAGGLFIAGTNAATVVTTSFTTTFTGNLTGSVGSVTGLTPATIATAVWTDTTAGDFTTLTSPGKIIFAQLGGAFTTTSSSVFTVGALANAPTGGSAPTVSQIATAVWEDLTAGGDFGTAGSIGKLIATTGLTLSSAGLDAVVVESGLNARQSLSIIAAACAGVLAGAATTTITINGAGVGTQRISATVDAVGDRSAVSLSPPA